MDKVLIFSPYALKITDGGPSGFIAQNLLGHKSDFYHLSADIEVKPNEVLPLQIFDQTMLYKIDTIFKNTRFEQQRLFFQSHFKRVNAQQYKFIYFHDVYSLTSCLPLLRDEQIILLQSHAPELPSYEIAGCPPVSEIEIRTAQFIQEEAFRRANILIFPNRYAQDIYSSLITQKHNIIYISSGSKRVDSINNNLYLSNKIVFLYIGRRNFIKGFDIVIKAFLETYKIRKDIELILVGNGQKIEIDGITDIGFSNIPHQWMYDCDYLINCNRQSYFDLSIMEALSMGTPIITSVAYGHKEFANTSSGIISIEEPLEINLKKIFLSDKLKKRVYNITAVNDNIKLYVNKYTDGLYRARLNNTLKSLFFNNTEKQIGGISNICMDFRYQTVKNLLNVSDNDLENVYNGELGKKYKELLASGIKHQPLSSEEKVFVSHLKSYIANGWQQPKVIQHFLAATLYCSPYQLPSKWYEYATVPNWFLNDLIKFTLDAPSFFQEIGEADLFYQYMKELVGFYHSRILNSPDSKLWQNIAMFFTQVANFIPLYFNNENLKDIYIKRSEIIEFFMKSRGSEIDYVFSERPTDRKKIRFGILKTHFLPQTETYTTMPVFEYLDRNLFEIILYTLSITDNPLEKHCRNCSDRIVKLPESINQQVQTIRADDLDILIIGNNVTAVVHQITLLALHRLARIQLTGFSSPVTTGMRNIRYYISGDLTESANSDEYYSEQLIRLKGTGYCFDYTVDDSIPSISKDRKSLGIPDNSVVFVSGANVYKILPELLETWAKIISLVPDSVLLLYPFTPSWTRSYPEKAFISNILTIFGKYGITSDRLIVIQPLANRNEVKQVLKLCNIYMDSYPYSGSNSTVDPLEVGLPTVVMRGITIRSNQAAALLKSLSISDLIADSEQSYIALAVKLGNNPQLRQYYREQIQQKMANNPPFLDSRGYSAKIGNLFKQLFEEYQSKNAAISAKPDPLSTEFMNLLIGCANLHGIDPTDSPIALQLRDIRKQLADFWLKIPSTDLERIYSGDGGVVERAMLESGFRNQALTGDEGAFLQLLIAELTAKTSSDPLGAMNYLLAAMLYLPKGRLNVQNARRNLPGWLIGDYERFF